MNEWEWQLLEDKTEAESVLISGAVLKKGDRVRLRPRAGGDIFDLALAGKAAVIDSIEQDYEGKLHLAVVVEEDPGKDLGAMRQPGHRFFFGLEEVEPYHARVLVAGIGNIFQGDDAFGVEVLRRLAGSRTFPELVQMRDFGIRSYDLAYALLEGYDTVILVDAAPRGEPPGTLYVIEPDLGALEEQTTPDPHSMNPVSVLRLAKSMGPVASRILLVACEPATLGGDEGLMGLSEAVSAAMDDAVKLVEKLIAEAVAK